MHPYSAAMTADPTVLDRIFDRLVRTLTAGSPDQLSATFKVSELVHALVPYRTYRGELGVDTIQDYEHAVLELLAGERGLLVVDPDTVTAIRKELASPDPDTGMLHRLGTVEVRLGAIRMPVMVPARPATRSEAPTRDVAPQRAVVSDAVAIGAALDLEDAARVREGADQRAAHPEVPAAPPVAAVAALPSVVDLVVRLPAEPPATTPLQAVRGVTIANPATLSRITPLSAPSVYGDPIEFRGLRHAPVDIGGVILLFGMVARDLGFNIEAMTSGFPRCEAKRQITFGKWARLRIDFELESRHFRDAARNPSSVDLLVCWRDTWPDRPSTLDVLALDRILPTLARE